MCIKDIIVFVPKFKAYVNMYAIQNIQILISLKKHIFLNLVFESDPGMLCTGLIFDAKNEVSDKAFFDFSCALRIVYAVMV